MTDIFSVTNEKVWLRWQWAITDKEAKATEFRNVAKYSSLTTGAYTTAQARILLFNELIQLKDHILYCDTDSIIYVERPGLNYTPNIGTAIGQLTDELSGCGEGAYIDEFVTIGPKSYAYRVRNAKGETFETCKCKGFTVKKSNNGQINFNVFKDLTGACTNDDDAEYDCNVTHDCIITENFKIKRKKDFNVISGIEIKKCNFTFNKRVCLNVETSLPYGHEDIQTFH